MKLSLAYTIGLSGICGSVTQKLGWLDCSALTSRKPLWSRRAVACAADPATIEGTLEAQLRRMSLAEPGHLEDTMLFNRWFSRWRRATCVGWFWSCAEVSCRVVLLYDCLPLQKF